MDKKLHITPARRFGPPDHYFDETQFATEVWNVLLGRQSNVIDLGSGTYTMKLNARYTINSERYNDSFIEGFLRRASIVLKMLTRLGKFASNSRQVRLSVDPLPLIPLRKAVQSFYDEMVCKINSCFDVQMQIENLEQCFEDLLSELEVVYDFFLPLIRQKESNSSAFSSVSSFSQVPSTLEYREEVDKLWHDFFYKLFVCPDAYHLNMNVWSQIFEGFLEILPSYLDKISEFADIRMDVEKDKVVLINGSHQEIAYFRSMWTDRLLILTKRAFTDRKRLYHKQKNPMAHARNWSDFFNTCLTNFKKDNPDIKKFIDVKVPVIKSLLEKSCDMYVTQFSRLILGELQYHQRLVSRVKELEGIFSLQSFADQIHQLTLEDYSVTDRNAVIQAYRRALSSTILPESTAKYWDVALGEKVDPYDFKLRFRGSWPTSLIITPQFLNNTSHVLQLMMKLLQYYMYYRALAVSCMFTNKNGESFPFTRKSQHHIFTIRQVLYRFYHCLIKKVGAEFRELLKIVQDSNNFNNLEAKVNRWHEKMKVFATDSHLAGGIDDLLKCAEDFIERCTSMNQSTKSSSNSLSIQHEQEQLTSDIRQRFVLACESLNLAASIQNENIVELTAFEHEVSLIVGHISYCG
ncbi:hypothetical protein M3Y97_00309600 [Aphelenchoides bicaudatus]|nr:hypothetical protein M3Y97_00309600 [Aphelenchoides bicaudatus]